ncbi:MAG: rhodanese-like domain-containing protein [Chromatiaceae bacterium]|jgi:rhodanese-related sulfurtransferase|nr:rhodanese-like domain-containing protein [Chromatiaceae bacterium]
MVQPGGSKALVAEVLSLSGGDRSAPVALIGATGTRGARMQRLLAAEGFTAVYNVREGMLGSGAGPGWLRRGLPIVPCPTCWATRASVARATIAALPRLARRPR